MEERQQELTELINELLNGVSNGDWEDPQNIPPKYTWAHLEALFLAVDAIDGGRQIFRSIHKIAMYACQSRIKELSKTGKKIRIVFQSFSAAIWQAEILYRKLEQLPYCEVGVFVCPLFDRDVDSRHDSYLQTREWFVNTGHKVWEGYDIDSDRPLSFEEAGACPDIIYEMSPWYHSLAPIQRITQLHVSVPIAFIDYGLNIQTNIDGDYLIKALYNKDIVNLCWRVYCDFPFNQRGFQKHQILEGANVKCYGYAKMDYFYSHPKMTGEEYQNLWKLPDAENAPITKKVIYAPHFSIFNEAHLLFSTFQHNLWFFLYLAEKYSGKVSFILKPHPNLRATAVTHGLFASYEEYDAYIAKWNNLPNSKVVSEGSYLEIFETSDALITDSISFIGEYMYTGKPMLLLHRPEQRFNELGEKILDVQYQAEGQNYSAIEKFLQDVVMEENDSLYEERQKLFQEEFDYVARNGATASEMIYRDFLDLAC